MYKHSKKLKKFRDSYEKDTLQTLSKLKVAIPDSYQHISTLLNIHFEHKKTAYVQLKATMRITKAHFNNDIIKEAIKEGGSMMCMYVWNGSGNAN